jgi:hypothetical protein
MSKCIGLILVLIILFAILAIISGCTSNEYQLSTSIVPAGGGTVNPSSGVFKDGSIVTLVASPAQYYRFDGWAGEASGANNPLTVNMNSNQQIVARFSKIVVNVQTKSNPSDGGTVTAQPNSESFEAGTPITITAIPAAGFRFNQWKTGAAGNSNPLRLIVDNNIVITADFIKQYALTVSSISAWGTVSPTGGTYDSGTKVNLTATPLFPYAFKNWVEADTNNVNPSQVTMNSNKSVQVGFIKLPPKTPKPITSSGQIFSGNINIPINLNKDEWLEGYVNRGPFDHPAYLIDPSGKNIKDLGSKGQTNFQLLTPISGIYNLVIERNFMYQGNYDISYTIYGLQ